MIELISNYLISYEIYFHNLSFYAYKYLEKYIMHCSYK